MTNDNDAIQKTPSSVLRIAYRSQHTDHSILHILSVSDHTNDQQTATPSSMAALPIHNATTTMNKLTRRSQSQKPKPTMAATMPPTSLRRHHLLFPPQKSTASASTETRYWTKSRRHNRGGSLTGISGDTTINWAPSQRVCLLFLKSIPTGFAKAAPTSRRLGG